MIRIILSTVLILFSLINMICGGHPAYGIVAGLIAVTLVAWYCVNKFEDEPQLN